jgi:predicted AlkP superfamily pyrophosphatase or phosphodiesterase
MRARRVGQVAVAFTLAFMGAGPWVSAAPERSPDTSAPSRPRLVLALSIDQMRYDYLVRFAPLFKGGFKALLDKGAVFTSARYRHACTETGPGHSVILSGRSPNHSGIVANSWYDSVSRKSVNVVDDPVQAPIGGLGRAASPANFIGFTLGDVLKKTSPASRVVGVSLKDRAAILMAGRRADAAYWYEAKEGHFITSTYYVKEAPAWLAAWNARHIADRYAGRPWTRLLPDTGLYLKYAGPDDIDGESDRKDTVFPHALPGTPPSPEYYDGLRSTPAADEMVLGAALAAMDAHDLGRRDATDLLAIGFSGTDVIGHTYGPDSQEQMDQILRLDLVLGQLFEEVDERVGPGRTLVVLTADHGVMPLVEVLKKKGIEARRVSPEALEAPVKAALARRFPGATGIVANYDAPHFYLDSAAMEGQHIARDEVEAAISEALKATGLVDAVYTPRQMMGEAPAGGADVELFRRAFFEPRSPQILVETRPYVYIDDHPGGTGHGTPHDYDRHVPIVFRGPGVKAGSYDGECGPEDIAVTLGRLIGVDYPLQDASRILSEMFLRP